MKYVVEMGSSAIIYITMFHEDGFSHTKIDWGGIHEHTDSMVIA
jgi:hypothetical protein